MSNIFILRRVLILIITCYVFFFLGNSIVALTDPDEVFYSLTAKEMAAHNQWLVPYIFDQPQFEKPIFTYWLLRIAFDLWGITPFSARFFPALFACFGVLSVYALGLIGFRHERKAFYSALVLCSAGLFAGMAKTVFTDMFFTVFMLLGFLAFYTAFTIEKFKKNGLILFFVFIAFAVLSKGPLALTMAEMTVILFLLYVKRLDFLKTIWMPVGLAVCVMLALPWYLYVYKLYGQDFIKEFFINDHWRRLLEAEHKGNDRWFFYPLTIILGFFPWSLFVATAFVDLYKRLKTGLQPFEYFCISWILMVFVTFQFAHSKLASYILPLFPAVALLTGSLITDMIEKNYRIKQAKIFAVIMSVFIILLGVAALVAFPYYKQYVPDIMPIYFISGVLLTLGIISLSFIFLEQLRTCLMLQGLLPIILLGSLFLIKSDIQPYISTSDSAQYIPAIKEGTTVLTAKPYARGIKFFTDNKVTVLNINGGNYFSPHPVEILTTEDQLKSYLRRQNVTFAVLKKSGYKAITNLSKQEFRVSLIKLVGYNYILKIEAVS